jgi:polysaccharide biosynthesis protein PslF
VKVLFVSGEFPPMEGGVGDYTREIGLALADQGCQVHVVTSAHAGPVAGLSVLPVVQRWDWGSWRILLEVIRKESPDVVHIQYQAAAYAMHPAINFFPRRLRLGARAQPRSSPRYGTPQPLTAVTFHDLKIPYLFPKAGPLRPWVVKELARSCDLAVTTNREDFERLEHDLDRPPALIPIGSNIRCCLPEGYDRDAWRARWGVGTGDLLLCFFGFVNDRKGVDTLLRALDRLVAQDDQARRTFLLMIGGQTGASDPTNVAYLAEMEALIADLHLEDRVLWTGYVAPQEVSASFLAADLCVLPFRDGVSLLHGTLHAALAHGVPIVTTQPRVALPELTHGKNVYLVPRQDPEALAGAIQRLAGDAAVRQALGEGAKALSEEFRWDRIAAETLALYKDTVARDQA